MPVVKTSSNRNIKVSKQAVDEAFEALSNWGRWGKDDQIGTLNHVRPEDIVKAASLIRTGRVFALGIPLDRTGPQTGLFGGRFNPIHQMLATGTDAIAGRQDWNNIRYADDTLMLCVQGATHWDALGHVFGYAVGIITATTFSRLWSADDAAATLAAALASGFALARSRLHEVTARYSATAFEPHSSMWM